MLTFSSDPSEQSVSPSQRQVRGKHWPSQRRCVSSEQVEASVWPGSGQCSSSLPS